MREWLEEAFEEDGHLSGYIEEFVDDCPTIDAVPAELVAQMLDDLFEDSCPCNYSDIDTWLPFVCDDGELCGDHDDPLYCWKQYIKHYSHEPSDGGLSNEAD